MVTIGLSMSNESRTPLTRRRFLTRAATAAEPARAVHLGQGDGDPEDGLGRGWMAADGGRAGSSLPRSGCASLAGVCLPGGGGAGRVRRRETGGGLSVAAVALAGGVVQPDGAAGALAAVRAGIAGELVPAGAGGAAAAIAPLHRRIGDGLRAGELPADGGAGVLLQRRQVSLSVRVARWGVGKTRGSDELPSGRRAAGPGDCAA